jgi:hypothetical protein
MTDPREEYKGLMTRRCGFELRKTQFRQRVALASNLSIALGNHANDA